MSKIVSFLLLFAFLSCKKEEFSIYFYDGEYPRHMDGSRIETFAPEVFGGEMDVKYNGHPWNHAPFFNLSLREWNPPKSLFPVREVNIEVIHMETRPGMIGGCMVETFGIRCPLKEGWFDLNTLSKAIEYEYHTIRYKTINCDAGKDHYALNTEKANFIEIIRFDELNRKIELQFDVHFKMSQRNPNFGPVYPTHVHLRGTIEGTLRPVSE